MLHRIFFGGDKYPESANKYTKFDQLIIRKIIKILPPDVTLKAEMHQIRVLASVRFFAVRLCVRWRGNHGGFQRP